jgi:hypothetical protein
LSLHIKGSSKFELPFIFELIPLQRNGRAHDEQSSGELLRYASQSALSARRKMALAPSQASHATTPSM